MTVPASAELVDAVRGDHLIASRVQILDGSSPSTVLATLDVVLDGSVTADAGREIMRDCSLSLVDETGTLTPESATDLLAPFGNEVSIERGVVLPAGTEYVPLGVFRLSSCQISGSGGAVSIALAGYDRGGRIARNRWTSSYQLPSGLVTDALRDLLLDRWPEAPIEFDDLPNVTNGAVLDGGAEQDPWAEARRIARDHGLDLYVDPAGVFRLRALPDPLASPVVRTHAEGTASVLLDTGRDLDDDEAYSGVVVIVESPDNANPLRAEAWDDDPSSATYRLGKFGSRPKFVATPLLTTQDATQQTADTVLASSRGMTEKVAWAAIPDPTIEPWDVVSVTDSRKGVAGSFVVESLSIGLSPNDQMSLVGRKRSIA